MWAGLVAERVMLRAMTEAIEAAPLVRSAIGAEPSNPSDGVLDRGAAAVTVRRTCWLGSVEIDSVAGRCWADVVDAGAVVDDGGGGAMPALGASDELAMMWATASALRSSRL